MRTKLLTALKEADDYISGQILCERFGVSRTAIWKAVNQLKEAGYRIEAIQNRGYKIISIPDRLNKSELLSIRKTSWAGREIFYYDTIDSTNTRAKQLAEEGYPEGTLVVASSQEAGRGRRGRCWESPEGLGIYMTLILKPAIDPNHASMLTLVAAPAVAVSIAKCTGVSAGIKWPNDIVVRGKKVCGILTEMSVQFDYVNYIVLGIGINVHNEGFPEEIRDMASSIYQQTGQHINRAMLIEEILEQFERRYAIYLKTEDLSALAGEYNAMLVNTYKDVKVLDPKGAYEGRALGINERGELIVDTRGSQRLISSGEVSVRGICGYV